MNQLQTSNHSFLLFLNTLLAVSPKWHRVKRPRISITKMKQMETVMMNILTACYDPGLHLALHSSNASSNCAYWLLFEVCEDKWEGSTWLTQCKGEEGMCSYHQKLNDQEGKAPKECGVLFIPLGLWIVDCVYYGKVISRLLKIFV